MKRFWLAACLIGTTMSCVKKPETTDSAADVVTSYEEIQTAVESAVSFNEIFDIKLNEYVYYTKDIAGSTTSARRVFLTEEKEIIQVDPPVEANEFATVYHIKSTTLENVLDGNQKPTMSERTIYVAKQSPATSAAASAQLSILNVSMPITADYFMALAQAICKPTNGYVPDCRRLRVWETVEEPPPLIKARPDCGGLNPCQINKKYISFDATVNGQKIIHTISICKSAPAMAKIMEYCIEGLADINNQKVPVVICQRIRDWRRN